MKNLFLLSLAALLILAGCTQDSLQTDSVKQTKEQLRRARMDQMLNEYLADLTDPQNESVGNRGSCSKVPISHNGNTILVNVSAIPGHVGHGDPLNGCATSCINTCAALQGGAFNRYYDAVVNDCFGFDEDIVVLSSTEGIVVAENFFGTYYIWSHDHNAGVYCEVVVSQAEFECAKAYLRSIIAANSCLPNYCD